MSREERVIIVAGATASGKTALARHIAASCGGEIISADSMKVYRGADVGSSKPPESFRREVKYHLIDIIDPDERYDAGSFFRDACRLIDEMHSRGVIPVVSGGTSLYITRLMEGIADIPPVPGDITEELSARPVVELYEELQRTDPGRAAAIHPNMKKRIVRALGVFRHTGMRMSRLLEETVSPPYTFIPVTVEWEREVLYERINRRVDRMVREGLLEEVRTLLERYGPSAPVFEGVGYRQFLPAAAGETSPEEAAAETAKATRNYARSQLIWWRNRKKIPLRGSILAGYGVLKDPS